MTLHDFARRVAGKLPWRVTPGLRSMWNSIDSRVARLRGKQVVHVLHVHKTGGTAMQNALRGARSDRYAIRLWSHSTTIHQVPEGDKVVAFVRDPVARFVSGYHYRQAKGLSLHYEKWSPQEEYAFAKYPVANDLAEALPAAPAVNALLGIQHLTTLTHFLGCADEFRRRAADVLFIGRVESFERDFQRLCDILGVTASLPSDPAASNRRPVDQSDTALSTGAVKNLKAWYSDDYKLLAEINRLLITPDPGDDG